MQILQSSTAVPKKEYSNSTEEMTGVYPKLKVNIHFINIGAPAS